MQVKTNLIILQCILVFFSLYLQNVVSCNGYQITHSNVKHCDRTKGQDVIKFDKIKLSLRKDCFIIPKGCTVVTKTYHTANAQYRFVKPPLPPVVDDADLCINKDSLIVHMLLTLGVPNHCPIKAKKYCNLEKFSMEPYKHQLPLMAGNVSINLNIDHDVGQTCADILVIIARSK